MRLYIAAFVILSLTAAARGQTSGEINLSTLLTEMVDREQITRFPENGYCCLQASSYNRESVSPHQPGSLADSDGNGYIRTEIKHGQKE